MKFVSVICPTCRRTLTVSENAPPKLMCPRCLGAVDNPPGLLAQQAREAPRPVIPIAQQTQSDGRSATIAMLVLLPLLVCGTAAAFVLGNVQKEPLLIVPCVLLLGLVIYVLVIAQREYAARRSTSVSPHERHFSTGNQLEYGTAPQGPIVHPAIQFTGGFLLVVAVALLTVFNFRYLGNVLLEAMAVLSVLALISLAFRRFRAIGLGILVAMGLCILLPIGLCFAVIVFH